MSRTYILVSFLVAVCFIVMSALFTVDERQKALVLQFGEVIKIIEKPGLATKIPFIQTVVKYDGRILPLDTLPLEVTMKDNRRFDVDAFARWRIADVKAFRRAVGSGGAGAAASRLEQILNAELRTTLGEVNSSELLSVNRVKLMNTIRDSARAKASALGVDIIDVRIKRADLPIENLNATFSRMRAEREQDTAKLIAEGNEAAKRATSLADRTVVETLSEAQKNADIVRGEADAERNSIFAEAFGRDPEFFAFYRSLTAYENSLKGSNSTLVISPDSEFFDYLKSASIPTEK
ncbi:MAG: protease modulator HflC [Paracoccaceae bacterium]|jgi:membrane protease subunit HflC|nr:protease modulator HflC [Paracoccaceae bacterium]|tara:strand:+ start:461 stop:1339 length:879 start_codon:yes stop_codon:yes gene_type:complete